MSRQFLEFSVGFNEPDAARLTEACRLRGINRTALIRTAVSEYLDRHESVAANFKRIAMMTEFTQLAVDILVREQAPNRREDIVAAVQERMERYHA